MWVIKEIPGAAAEAALIFESDESARKIGSLKCDLDWAILYRISISSRVSFLADKAMNFNARRAFFLGWETIELVKHLFCNRLNARSIIMMEKQLQLRLG